MPCARARGYQAVLPTFPGHRGTLDDEFTPGRGLLLGLLLGICGGPYLGSS